MKKVVWFGAILMQLMAWEPVAFAYQFGVISTDGTKLQSKPDPGADTLKVLEHGTRVTAEDEPKDGFFKVRERMGTVGYIAVDAFQRVELQPPVATKEKKGPEKAPDKAPDKRPNRFSIKLFGGFDFFTPSSLNQQLGISGFSNGVVYGTEIGYMLSRRWTILFRIEKLQSQLADSDTTTVNTYNLSLTAIPISTGFEYSLTGDRFVLGVAGLAGLGYPHLATTATNLAAPNETDMSGTAISAIFRLDAALKLTSWLSLYGEGGYRLLKASSTTITVTGNGSSLFGTPAAAVPLDMSGPILDLGLKLSF
jgi:hypothetical protein